MRQYAKNVLRGVRRNLLQYVGAVLIIALAVTVFIGLYDYAKNLEENAVPYFDDYDFADIFAEVEGISESELTLLKETEGVSDIFGRQSVDVRLETGEAQIVTLHLLAYTPQDTMNRMKISAEDGQIAGSEIYLSKAMQNRRQYAPGDTLALILNGTRTELGYAGTVISPQYIYYVPSGDIEAPVDDLYAIAAVDKAKLEQMTGRPGEVNEIGVRLSAGADVERVRDIIEARLGEMGTVLSVYTRKDQSAYDTLTGEIETYETISYIPPPTTRCRR